MDLGVLECISHGYQEMTASYWTIQQPLPLRHPAFNLTKLDFVLREYSERQKHISLMLSASAESCDRLLVSEILLEAALGLWEFFFCPNWSSWPFYALHRSLTNPQLLTSPKIPQRTGNLGKWKYSSLKFRCNFCQKNIKKKLPILNV